VEGGRRSEVVDLKGEDFFRISVNDQPTGLGSGQIIEFMATSKASYSSFKEITVQGFRCLQNFKLELRPFCVMIGANGVGKTSILDAFRLLSRSAGGRLNETVSEFGGIGSILSYGSEAESIQFEIAKEVQNRDPLVYQLEFASGGTGYQITEERLLQARSEHQQGHPFVHLTRTGANVQYFDAEGKLVRPTWEYNPLESALSQVPKMFDEPEAFRHRLSFLHSYHHLDVGPKAPVRLPQAMKPAGLPGRNGEDLVACLYTMRESERERFEAVEDALRAAFPRFERLEFPPVAAGTIAMVWREKNLSSGFYMHQLSEGTLRFLWLVTLLQSAELGAITLIDEPEVSLHPELLAILAELMRESSKRTQLIVATHSDRLIRFLEPGEVLCMDRSEEKGTQAAWGDEMGLEAWLADYSLDELWQMGRLGGRS
jgi:predicted ATPase